MTPGMFIPIFLVLCLLGIDRLVLEPIREFTLRAGRLFARMHRGQINAYAGYVLVALLVALIIGFLL